MKPNKKKKARIRPSHQDNTFGVSGFLIAETPAAIALKELKIRLDREATKQQKNKR